MENTVENTQIDSQQGTKLLMQSYLSFLRNMSNKNQDEVSQKLREIIEIFSHLSEKDLFCSNEEISESEKYFINEFAPDLLKILLNENNKNPLIRENIFQLLLIYVKEFKKALENICLENFEFKFNFWERVIAIFNSEDNLFYRTVSDNKDASDCFLENIYEKLNPNYLEWRESLKPDDLIDYLYKENNANISSYKGIGVCNWTRAKILSLDANKVAQILIIGTDDIINISLTSFMILPYKTFSKDDYEWREEIKKGDEIDFLDNRSWYRSTVLDVHENISLRNLLSKSNEDKKEATKRKIIKYGLRVYRPAARHTDSKGNNFFGWGETYDKETSVHDPRIRKPNTFSKQIQNYDIINYYPLDSKRFTELETIIPSEFKENKFYIIPKKFENRNISNYYYEILNYFCLEENAFEIILKILNLIENYDNNNNNNKSSIDQFFPVFSILISFFNNINHFLHFEFARSYLTSVIESSFSILKKFSLIETRNFKREKFENLIKHLKEIMYRVNIDSDVNAHLDLFGIDFGINCLKNSIILDKKLLGFKVLNDTMTEVAKNCGNNSGFTDRHLPASTLVEKITNENVFEIIYGPSSHSQILQKSSEFIKSLLITKNLKTKDFQKLFDICEEATDNEAKSAIYKGLINNSIQLTVEISYFIINYLIRKKKNFLQSGIIKFKITNEDIDLLISAFKALPLTAVKEISKSVGEFLFDIIFYEEENIENNNNNLIAKSNLNSDYNSTSNSPNNPPHLDNNINSIPKSPSVNSIAINNNINNKENNNSISILYGLKYEKIVEDFLVLMKSIEFRDYSNKMFEDILIILKNGKLDDKENISNKDFIGIIKILRLLMGSYLNILDDSTRSRLLILIYDEYSILDMLMSFISQYHKEVWEILNKEKLESETNNNNINNDSYSNNNNSNNNALADKNSENKKSNNDRIFKVSRNNAHKHSDVVMEIINFVTYMMTSQKMINLTKDQILILYQIYVEEPIYKSDINIFFKMLKEADSKKAIPQEVFQNVFEMMIQSKKLEFSEISLDLFNCVWNFFLIINKNQNNIILNEGNSKPENYSSIGPSGQQLYSFSHNNNKDDKNEDIKCVVDPNDLIGFDLIWRLVLSSSINTQVSKVSINNVIKIFFNVCIPIKIESSSDNKDNNQNNIEMNNKTNNIINTKMNNTQRGNSWGLLIEKCIDTIKKITNNDHNISTDKEESNNNGNSKHISKSKSLSKEISFSGEFEKLKSDKQTKILNCLNILRIFIEETEKKGTAGCISHNSLLKSSLITLKIENAISVKGSGAAYSSSNNNNNHNNDKSFTLKVYSNTTLWDLKKLIAKKINTLPEGIRLNTNNSKDITDNDHGKTLAELNLKDQEKLTVLLSQVFQNIPKQPLSKNGKFTEKAEKTLTDIFLIFANENNLMDQESAARFATVATDSSEPLLVDDSRVKYLFESYDFDKDGFVTLEGFLKFFHDSIEVNRKVDTVWDNIRAFGYRNDLKKYFEPLDEYNNDLGIMPRYSISKNQEYFNTIFKLQDEDEKIAKEASKFLSIICTNPVIYRDILLLKELKEIENSDFNLKENKNEKNNLSNIWLKYIDVNNRYKLLYVLQIIESFFEEFEFSAGEIDSEPFESTILDESVKSDLLPNHKIWWIENFLTKGGLELIIQKLYLNIDFNEIVSSHYLWKKILNLSTKIIKNSFSFLFRAFNLNKSEVVQFIRKESFGAIDDLALKNKMSSFEESNNINSTETKGKDNNYNNNNLNNDLKKQISKKLTMDIENLKRDEELLHLLNEKYGDAIITRINFEQIALKLIVFSYIISLKKETEVKNEIYLTIQ